jgi:two-component system chemotaxis response regulator CheB
VPGNGCDVVVVGASAGGVEALTRFVRGLPADFPAPVLVVLHVPSTGRSLLPEILSRSGPLPARHAENGQPLDPGTIYVAPPDEHMTVSGGRVELTHGPRENGHRPAVDPLFRSASLAYDGRAAGVILSGTLDDGTAGLAWIKLRGGTTLVQDPEDALYTGMPCSAIEHVQPEYVERVEQLVDTLVRLAAATGRRPAKEASMDPAPTPSTEQAQPGEIAPFQCPDCGGTLWESETSGITTYRCRVGHAYAVNSLLAKHAETVEGTLWTAYRALEEKAAMSHRIARRLRERKREESAARFDRQAETATRQAEELKRILDDLEPPPEATVEPAAVMQAAG